MAHLGLVQYLSDLGHQTSPCTPHVCTPHVTSHAHVAAKPYGVELSSFLFDAAMALQRGNTIPSTSIFVDVFHLPLRGGGVYVLTHAHSDHMARLRSGWIICLIHRTQPTAHLLTFRFGISAILRIHCLEMPFVIEDPANPSRDIKTTALAPPCSC